MLKYESDGHMEQVPMDELKNSRLKQNIYVDDIFDGAEDLSEAQRKRDQLIALSVKGGFDLDKWVSNHHSIW